MSPEEFDALLEKRWSCRAFLKQPVSREIITEIFRTAQRTASWNNVQPWQATIVSGEAIEALRRVLLREASQGGTTATHFPFPKHYHGVHDERRRACGYQLCDAVGGARGDKPAYFRQSLRNFAFFDAPQVAILSTEDDLSVYGVLDCGAFLTNAMNAATAHGVASIAQAAISLYADTIHDFLGLPSNRCIVCGMSFGFPDLDHPVNGYRVPRADLEEAVTWFDDPRANLS